MTGLLPPKNYYKSINEYPFVLLRNHKSDDDRIGRTSTQNFKLYIGTQKQEMIIKNYRKHKMYDMVLFYDINDINEALKYKGQSVYINKDDITFVGEIKGLSSAIQNKNVSKKIFLLFFLFTFNDSNTTH